MMVLAQKHGEGKEETSRDAWVSFLLFFCMQVGTWGKARGVPVLASGLPRGFGSLGCLSMMDKWALDI